MLHVIQPEGEARRQEELEVTRADRHAASAVVDEWWCSWQDVHSVA